MMRLPIELSVSGECARVVGADEIVVPKVERLVAAGARVVVHAAGVSVCPALEALAASGAIDLVAAAPDDAELAGAWLTFVSPALEAWARPQHARARREGRLLCVIDRPEHSTFTNPAAFEVSGIGVRLVSHDVSPGLVQQLRRGLERALDTPELAAFVARLRELRASTPRERRTKTMRAAVRGTELRAALSLPAWFTAGEDPPEAR